MFRSKMYKKAAAAIVSLAMIFSTTGTVFASDLTVGPSVTAADASLNALPADEAGSDGLTADNSIIITPPSHYNRKKRPG